MHNVGQRFNFVATYSLTLAALLAILCASTEYFHRSSPKINVNSVRIERLLKHDVGVEEAILSFDLDADMRSCFSWNTKQLFMYIEAEFYSQNAVDSRASQYNSVVIWDKLITKKESSKLRLKKVRNEYRLYDRDGMSLKGNSMNITVSWNVMPKVGKLYHDKMTFPNWKLPNEYVSPTNP